MRLDESSSRELPKAPALTFPAPIALTEMPLVELTLTVPSAAV